MILTLILLPLALLAALCAGLWWLTEGFTHPGDEL